MDIVCSQISSTFIAFVWWNIFPPLDDAVGGVVRTSRCLSHSTNAKLRVAPFISESEQKQEEGEGSTLEIANVTLIHNHFLLT